MLPKKYKSIENKKTPVPSAIIEIELGAGVTTQLHALEPGEELENLADELRQIA